MILGIGTDIVDITRIRSLLRERGDLFKKRVFTPGEQSKCDRTVFPERSYAKRFAAKEAFVKALQTNGDGISWTEIEIINLPSGAPEFSLKGRAQDVLLNKHPQAKAFLSMSDTETLAQAFVVIGMESVIK